MAKQYNIPNLPKDYSDASQIEKWMSGIQKLFQSKNDADNKKENEIQNNINSSNSSILNIETILENFACFVDSKPKATNAGTFTSGSWVTRTFNTEVVNNIDGCSLNSNIITLPAGTYLIYASAPAYHCANNKTRVYDNTGSVVLIEGTVAFSSTSYSNASSLSISIGVVDITVQSDIILQHRCDTTQTVNGLGVQCSFDTGIFSIIILWKIK